MFKYHSLRLAGVYFLSQIPKMSKIFNRIVQISGVSQVVLYKKMSIMSLHVHLYRERNHSLLHMKNVGCKSERCRLLFHICITALQICLLSLCKTTHTYTHTHKVNSLAITN